MSKAFAILPCNGLDKCAGCVTREIALEVAKKTNSHILCPVFYRISDKKYSKLAEENPLIVLDGCNTRCATKLATEKKLAIHERINITEKAQEYDITLGNNLELGDKERELVELISDSILAKEVENEETSADGSQETDSVNFPKELNYEIYKKDKFVFRVPTNDGFYFNENDVWVYVDGNKARVGITDFVQKSLSDIMFFTPPAVGSEIEQFEEMGEAESGKAIFEIVSPVSGVITKVNNKINSTPEILNDNPYEQGWIAEMELSDFDDDKELLYNFDGYFSTLKRKVDEFRV